MILILQVGKMQLKGPACPLSPSQGAGRAGLEPGACRPEPCVSPSALLHLNPPLCARRSPWNLTRSSHGAGARVSEQFTKRPLGEGEGVSGEQSPSLALPPAPPTSRGVSSVPVSAGSPSHTLLRSPASSPCWCFIRALLESGTCVFFTSQTLDRSL